MTDISVQLALNDVEHHVTVTSTSAGYPGPSGEQGLPGIVDVMSDYTWLGDQTFASGIAYDGDTHSYRYNNGQYDYERGSIGWEGVVFTIQTENAGGTDRAATLKANNAEVRVGYGAEIVSLFCNTQEVFQAAETYVATSVPFATLDGLSPTQFYLYNTFTDVSNYERAMFGWSSDRLIVETQEAGTGASRGITLNASDLIFLRFTNF